MKKTVSLFLSILMLLFLLPAVALAEDSSASPSPTTTAPASATSAAAGLLSIDNTNLYAGMNKSYSQGYIPGINNGTASVVLPLVPSGDIKDNKINVSVDLGNASSSPFVFGNYDQTISLQNNSVNNGAGTVPSYLVALALPMTSSRVMGRYPVTVTVSYTSSDGTALSQSFSVYVTVSDGKDPNATPTPSPTPTPEPTEAPLPQPKLVIQNQSITPGDVTAGGTFDLNVTLLNTSDSQSVQNIKITAKGDTTDLIPVSDTGSTYIKRISSGKTADFHVKMQVQDDAKPTPQKILLTIEYENSKATAFTDNEEIIVQIKQPLRLEYDNPTIPQNVNAGDTVSISMNLMNMGKSTLYNVRCTLDAPGLIPQGSAYIGNMDPGTSKSSDLYVFIGTKDMTATDESMPALITNDNSQSNQYGSTEGKITISYEDEYGQQYTKDIDVSTTINPPVIQTEASANPDEQNKPDTVSQWWVSVVIAGAIAAGLFAFLRIRKRKRLLAEEDHEDE